MWVSREALGSAICRMWMESQVRLVLNVQFLMTRVVVIRVKCMVMGYFSWYIEDLNWGQDCYTVRQWHIKYRMVSTNIVRGNNEWPLWLIGPVRRNQIILRLAAVACVWSGQSDTIRGRVCIDKSFGLRICLLRGLRWDLNISLFTSLQRDTQSWAWF